MNFGLLHLNDQGIALLDNKGSLLNTSALAIFRQDQLIFGQAAEQQCRINPTLAYSQHWQQLDQQTRKLPSQKFRHHADMAYQQLGQWFETYDAEQPLVIASSFSYNDQQYALLAGLLHAHKLKPAAFIDAGLLQTCGYLDQQSISAPIFYHLDLSLHNARLLAMRLHQGHLERIQQWDFPGIGYLPLQEAWLKIVAQTCIRQTRYDPLHSAISEQRLFEKIPESWNQLMASAVIELEIDGHKIELNQSALIQLQQKIYAPVSAIVSSSTLLLSPTAHSLINKNYIPLSADTLEQGFTKQAHYWRNTPALKYHTRLPAESTTKAVKCQSAAEPAPTHLLAGHIAQPLSLNTHLVLKEGELQLQAITTGKGLVVASFSELETGWILDVKSSALMLNGRPPASGVELQLGDVIATAHSHQGLICIALAGAENGS